MYCSNCGTEINNKSNFCNNCGTQIDSTSRSNESAKPYDQSNKSFKSSIKVPKRDYWKYGGPLIISIILSIIGIVFMFSYFIGMTHFVGPGMMPPTFRFFVLFPLLGLLSSVIAIYYAYYIYLNFDDLRQLQLISHSNDVYPQPHEPILGLVLLIVFAPAAFFLKYDHLHKHLKEFHGQTDKLSPSPLKFIGVWIISGFLGFFSVFGGLFLGSLSYIILPILIAIGSFLYLVLLEKQWQEALNTHIDHHSV